jgi:molybdopterin-guanine dinucleotide biosynthesis protein B
VIKHAPHGFEIDRPGTDTWNIRRTGVEQTLIVGQQLVAVLERVQSEPSLRQLVAAHVRPDVDLIVCEGFKKESHPKIEVARAAISTELMLGDDELLAVVADFAPRTRRAVFAPDAADAVADLVVRAVLRQ